MKLRVVEREWNNNSSNQQNSQNKFSQLGVQLEKIVRTSTDIKFLTMLATEENRLKDIAIQRLKELNNNKEEVNSGILDKN